MKRPLMDEWMGMDGADAREKMMSQILRCLIFMLRQWCASVSRGEKIQMFAQLITQFL